VLRIRFFCKGLTYSFIIVKVKLCVFLLCLSALPAKAILIMIYCVGILSLTAMHYTLTLWHLDQPTTLCLKKNILDIFDCNFKTNYQILIIFGTNIPDTTCHQMTI